MRRWPGQRRHFRFPVLPLFSRIAATNAIEPPRMANRLAAGELCRWSLYALEGDQVIAGDGLTAMPTSFASKAGER